VGVHGVDCVQVELDNQWLLHLVQHFEQLALESLLPNVEQFGGEQFVLDAVVHDALLVAPFNLLIIIILEDLGFLIHFASIHQTQRIFAIVEKIDVVALAFNCIDE